MPPPPPLWFSGGRVNVRSASPVLRSPRRSPVVGRGGTVAVAAPRRLRAAPFLTHSLKSCTGSCVCFFSRRSFSWLVLLWIGRFLLAVCFLVVRLVGAGRRLMLSFCFTKCHIRRSDEHRGGVSSWSHVWSCGASVDRPGGSDPAESSPEL